jgi:hypothetical protein
MLQQQTAAAGLGVTGIGHARRDENATDAVTLRPASRIWAQAQPQRSAYVADVDGGRPRP